MSLWINGEWRPGRGPGFSKQDPVNLKVVWQGEAADAGQVAEAVAAVLRYMYKLGASVDPRV
ncbi:hypothetical protein ACQSHF_28540, partial [Klebsiella pneumoniae]